MPSGMLRSDYSCKIRHLSCLLKQSWQSKLRRAFHMTFAPYFCSHHTCFYINFLHKSVKTSEQVLNLFNSCFQYLEKCLEHNKHWSMIAEWMNKCSLHLSYVYHNFKRQNRAEYPYINIL